MDLRTLRVFIAIAEQGSITRAAATLHQSTSAVSHTLLALEAELGLALFHRLPRGMALTDAGKVFVAAARRTLHEAEVARRSVDAIRGVTAGEVRVAAKLGFGVLLADLVADYLQRHPQVLVQVFPSESTSGVAELVRSGSCDLGFTWAATNPDDLEVRPVLTVPSVIVVPQGHRLAARTSAGIGDLRGERLVAPVTTSTMRPRFDALFRRYGIEPHVVAAAETNEMVLELVRAGVGCTVTVATSVAAVVGRGAVALGIDDHPANTVLLVTRPGQDPTPAAAAFAALAVERLSL